MKTLTTILVCASLFSPALRAEQAESASTSVVGQLSHSAEQELAKSIAELNALREKIAAEKLPLAQELTALEEKLVGLRRKHSDVTRLLDAGNLEIPTIKAEIKARRDEMDYIRNLLDEYARTFETKVHVSELQYAGRTLELAKEASTNVTLSPAQQFAAQTAFVDFSIKRALDVIGGLRFPGSGVDMQGTVVDGQFAIVGPVALFRANDGITAGLALPQSGSSKPLIRSLEGPLQAGLASVVQSGEGTLPLDPSRGAALKALVQKTNLFHIFKKGGPIMWPLLLASILSLGTVLERLLFLFIQKLRRSRKTLDAFFAAVTAGEYAQAQAIGDKSKFFVVRALGYALRHKDDSLTDALAYAQARELKRYNRGIPVLDTVITLAPLLGLLGTVTGMMGSFSLIGGDLGAPGEITGGIAEALIATAFGLGIAIISLVPFNYLNARIEEARHEMESAAKQLEVLVPPTVRGGAGAHARRLNGTAHRTATENHPAVGLGASGGPENIKIVVAAGEV